VKPSVAQVFQLRFGRKGFVAHTEQELQHYLQVTEHAQIDVMVQEIIPGRITDEYIVRGFFDRSGVLPVLQTVQKLRKYHPFTVATAYKSVPTSEISGFHDVVTEYLASLQYRGIFVAEIKRDSRDGEFKLLEVNARSGAGNAHLQVCGVNHILLAYCDAMQLPVSLNFEPKTNVYSTDCERDLISLWKMCLNGTLDFKDVLWSYLFGVDWLYAREDIIPLVKQLHTLYERFVRAS
jgi:predicted ATP-grasp superfamily ATP-dependent carboligase